MSLGTAIYLCDLTGKMAEPWVEAGYRAVLVDPQHPANSNDGRVEKLACTILEAAPCLSQIIRTENVVFVAGFPPCTDVAVSGSRWFEAKRQQDPHFQAKAALVAEQCRMVGMMAGCEWAFENPVSVFSSIFGRAQHSFHPWHFTALCAEDNYTKSTQLWTSGGFVMPKPAVHDQVAAAIKLVGGVCGGRMPPKAQALAATGNDPLIAEWYPDNRIHACPPSEERANIRSATPLGFAKAVFMANAPHLRHANDNGQAAAAVA